MSIVERIKKLQKEKTGKVSLDALEKELGIGKSVISSWDTKNKKPTIKRLLPIADYFDVSIDYLLGREKKAPDQGLSKIEEDLLKCFREVSPEARQSIIRVATNEYLVSASDELYSQLLDGLSRQTQDFLKENQA